MAMYPQFLWISAGFLGRVRVSYPQGGEGDVEGLWISSINYAHQVLQTPRPGGGDQDGFGEGSYRARVSLRHPAGH